MTLGKAGHEVRRPVRRTETPQISLVRERVQVRGRGAVLWGRDREWRRQAPARSTWPPASVISGPTSESAPRLPPSL